MQQYKTVDNEEGFTEEERLIGNQQKLPRGEKKQIKKSEQDTFDRMEQIGNWIWLKVTIMNLWQFQAVCWVTGAAATIYYSNFFKQLFHNEDINQLFLTISLLCIGVNCALAVYAAVILPYVLGIREEVDTYNPRAIQIGAFSGFLSFLTMIIAIWPVWGWLSFPMVFGLLLGFLNTGHFLPNHAISGIIFGGVFIGAFFSHHFIEHDGYWH